MEGGYWELRGEDVARYWRCMRKGNGGVILGCTGEDVARYWRCMRIVIRGVILGRREEIVVRYWGV